MDPTTQRLMSGAVAGGGITDPDFKNTVLLLHGDGTNGAQNNTFIDGSTNNFTITRNGNTTQGSFGPYGDRWSNYFDGSGDYLSFSEISFSSSFTAECWFYRGPNAPTRHMLFCGQFSGSGTSRNCQLAVSNNGEIFVALNNAVVTNFNNVGGNCVPRDSWNHIAYVRSGTNISVFVNGSRIANGTSSAVLYISLIGAFNSTAELNGYVSNARVTSTAVYDPSQTTITVPTAPLTAITNTSLLTCQSNRFIDTSINAFAITRNGDVRVTNFSPFGLASPYATSTDGGSGYFDGSGDYLTPASNAAFAFGTGDYSIELWMYPVTIDNDNESLVITGTASATTNYQLDVSNVSSGFLRFRYSDGNQITGTVVIGAWNHVVASRVSGTVRLFVNGVQQSSVSSAANLTDNNPRIGINRSSAFYFNGYISDVRLVKGAGVTSVTVPTSPLTAISNTSLLLNFTNAGIFDQTRQNVLETVGNAQISTSVKKYGSGSMYFDGSDDYLTIPASSQFNLSSGDWTIEYWVYKNANTLCTHVSQQAHYWRLQGNTNGTITLVLDNVERITSSVIPLTTWTHVAAVRNGTTITLYINGVSSGTTTATATDTNAGTIYLGTNPDALTTWEFNGYIDDLRITKGVARYTAAFTPPAAPFPDF